MKLHSRAVRPGQPSVGPVDILPTGLTTVEEVVGEGTGGPVMRRGGRDRVKTRGVATLRRVIGIWPLLFHTP
jgi:hypothetical protein